jgi:tRNA threonylcarbamoyladenosine biosynthesis protein TsaE
LALSSYYMPYMSTAMIWQINTTNSAGTELLGECLGSQLSGNEVIELRSDLGGGKTTFVRGLASGAKITDRVSSPTFTLSRIYKNKNLQIHHFDFYRLDNPGILREQLEEALSLHNAVVVVEWADIVKDVLPVDRLTIEFGPVANDFNERQITIKYPQSQAQLIAKAETKWASLNKW